MIDWNTDVRVRPTPDALNFISDTAAGCQGFSALHEGIALSSVV